MQDVSAKDEVLRHELLTQPETFANRFTHGADCHLRRVLFRSLACHRDDYLRYFFPAGPPSDRSERWCLRTAQGASEGAEYTAAAKGTACGHIFKSGESTYHCKTCAADDTCVLCAKCFENSDHDDHMVFISVSPGNSGCCDCGDSEAWNTEMHCSIHTDDIAGEPVKQGGKQRAPLGSLSSTLPVDLVEAMRATISRSVDYLCDVFSCSPEQLRLRGTKGFIQQDERLSRLSSVYGDEPVEQNPEFVLVLWNDEKHTVDDVQNQVARACRRTKRFGYEKAMEVNDIGRSSVHYSRDVLELLHMAQIIEQLKVTVTIRSARDNFREQMCATIIDWISDIAGCSVGNDSHVIRNIVCEELLKPWRMGSQASYKDIGMFGIDDHEYEDQVQQRRRYAAFFNTQMPLPPIAQTGEVDTGVDDDDNDDNDDNGDGGGDGDEDPLDDMDIEDDGLRDVVAVAATAASPFVTTTADAADMDIDFMDENDDMTEALEATFAGYPPPPPPPPAVGRRRRILTPADSDDGEAERERPTTNAPFENVPDTPWVRVPGKRTLKPSRHWLDKPEAFQAPRPSEPCEDLWQRVRLDFLILYDLRLWKTLRINLRHLYITTVVTIPHFKRILGLRFAGLYTALAELYLIADREPDHSIINLSVQMLTTPTITQEVVERGNFLTNLSAILYTFLTTRQVGFPEAVNPKATLAFDAGAVTNRRMFHFFLDLRWLFQSDFVRYCMRTEPRYLLQFLDLVKLHQGVCPNVRATEEHVEYESDTWISASMIVKEINKLCKQVAIAFEPKPEAHDHNTHLQRAIRTVAQVTMINSFGYERKRFTMAELKDDLAWQVIAPIGESGARYSVPKYVVQNEPMSFHHSLHYLLSWLLEEARNISREDMRAILNFSHEDLKDPWNVSVAPPAPTSLTPDELLCAIFEHPLRVCAWLAQMKAGMWVRNGITLRHQAHSYRSVSNRDVGYQRDITMIQAGLVLCGAPGEQPGERFLAQMIDRFQMGAWFSGDYSIVPGFEETQQLDVIEDFFHLLVISLCERGNLMPDSNGKDQHDRILQHDIAHALCFKPLSFSDLAGRVTEKVGESHDFNRVLESMTAYRPPEGLTDTGTFELKPEFIDLVDPYYAHYSRNHREEAENIYKKHVARLTGKKMDDIVYEPKLQKIGTGLFKDLSAFTATHLFVQTLRAALQYAIDVRKHAPKMQVTRVETFLHMVLQLTLIATMEDGGSTTTLNGGFVDLATVLPHQRATVPSQSLVSLLLEVLRMEDYASCHPTIKRVVGKMRLVRPQKLAQAIGRRSDLEHAETILPPVVDDKEKKKQESLARQARIMARMKQQQNSFLATQGLPSFGENLDDGTDDMTMTEEPEDMANDTGDVRKTWSFPTGTCILCQEETDDQRLYGTFAFLGESNILRSTPTDDPDYVEEVLHTPVTLDRPADAIRPFGVAGTNKQILEKVTSRGEVVITERRGLSKGFPHQAHSIQGPLSTSCGHIMHFSCFDLYLAATQRRHDQQIARNHPERIECKEFICPLCKALGNTFLPIIWKAKECSHAHDLHAAKTLSDWLVGVDSLYPVDNIYLGELYAATYLQLQVHESYSRRSEQYVANTFSPSLVANLQDLSIDRSPTISGAPQARLSLRRGYSLSTLFRMSRGNSQSSIDSPTMSPTTSSEQPYRMNELVRAYLRIDETIRANNLCSSGQTEDGSVNPVRPLSRALGLSISTLEIAQRGVGNDPLATSLLSELSGQSLTHLRILCETIESYLAVNVLRPAGTSPVARETVKERDIMIVQLFGVEDQIAMITLKEITGTLLFQEDIFLFFVDWLSFMAPSVPEALNILQLCHWAEIVKVIFVYKTVIKKQRLDSEEQPDTRAPLTEPFKLAVSGLVMDDTQDPYAHVPLSDSQLQALRLIVDKYRLTFLRKAILLMHVRYGLDFNCPYNLEPEKDELQRLTALLHLPQLDDICATYTSQSAGSEKLRQITKRWIQQADMIAEQERVGPSTILVPHPAIFELVGLPKHYDTLTEEAIKRKCPTTGKEITDPAVCLFCGAIFCSQAVCCMKDKNKGGCYQHVKRCGGKVGIFINVRKCMVLFMHGPGNGCYAHAPYLDRHGEPDPTLRRHHQLFLNQKRYDKLLRDAWLGHMIPTVISRKLEGDINPGGWQTL